MLQHTEEVLTGPTVRQMFAPEERGIAPNPTNVCGVDCDSGTPVDKEQLKMFVLTERVNENFQLKKDTTILIPVLLTILMYDPSNNTLYTLYRIPNMMMKCVLHLRFKILNITSECLILLKTDLNRIIILMRSVILVVEEPTMSLQRKKIFVSIGILYTLKKL